MKGKRSSQVQLVMLGTVLIGACSDENIPKDRYVYKEQQECVQDWGETNCEPSRKSSGAGAAAAGALAGAYFFGPRFNQIVETPGGKHVWSGTPDRPAVNPQNGNYMGSKAMNVPTPRGGFGSSARATGSIGT
jgi:uncharacterized protein YgiB involved in biofilm formation